MTSLTVHAVLFDMDGTLVDSTSLVESIWTEFAARNGLDPTTVISFAHGRPTRATVHEFIPTDAQRIEELALIHSMELSATMSVQEIPGAAALIGALPAERTAIVTSASREVALHRLRIVGITPPAVLITAEDVTAGKPSPQGYDAALRALDADASRSVVFEDAEAGILAGRASGATTVVVGDHDSHATKDLSRLPDFRSVRADVRRREMELTWP